MKIRVTSLTLRVHILRLDDVGFKHLSSGDIRLKRVCV